MRGAFTPTRLRRSPDMVACRRVCAATRRSIPARPCRHSDACCQVKNAYLNGLVNFQNFSGAQGSAGAGLVRSTVAVVTAAPLAALLV